jgi:pyrroline-5-carboxylate reductase
MSIEKITILGGGNIGLAIAQGLVKSRLVKAGNITITRLKSQPMGDLLKKGFDATYNNIQAIKNADLIFVAVQPRQYQSLLKEIKLHLNKKQTIVSVVSAVTIEQIEKIIGSSFLIVRMMPNTAISVCESMTCLSSNDNDCDQFKTLLGVLNRLGKTLVIDEKMMAAATVLDACGIAFFLRMIRAASQGGIQVGFHSDEAQFIAAQTAKGAVALLSKPDTHPEDEIDKVTTPLGLTIKGLNEMEHQGLSSAIIKGIVHSYNEFDKLS